jgi:ATP-binding cassette subfamily B protein
MTFTMQNVLMVFVEAIFLYFGIRGLRSATLTIGDFLFLQTALGTLFNRTWDLSRVIRVWHEAMAEAKEMVEILEQPHGIMDRLDAKALTVKKGEIVFDRVRFKYGSSAAVLNDVNLSIHPGEKVALVGPSGAGKSTIVKLLFRFYDLTKGRILVDGQDIAKVTQDSLRDHISLVPQEPILFHRTLKENIRYGRPDATDKEIIQAAKQAHCHDFIVALEKGYDTYVGERGVKLSGGERQRVAIARAILKNAPILVLDEATSSLDSESEHLIQDALKQLMKDKTVIVIAHRLSTIMQMDRIVVLEQGKVADMGTHEELLKTEGGLYRKLWELQAGGFLME